MKAIPGHRGYFISRKGYVYSNKCHSKNLLGELRFKTLRIYSGYAHVGLYLNRIEKLHKVHRLVAITYIPNPNNYPLVLHIDNNPLNNYYKNLKWGTHKMNTAQMLKEGRGKGGRKGKLTLKDIKIIKSSKLGNKVLAEVYGVSYGHIVSIKNGRVRNK